MVGLRPLQILKRTAIHLRSGMGSWVFWTMTQGSRRQWSAKAGLSAGQVPTAMRRGSEDFVEVSWETANRLVAEELQRVIQNHGNQAIFAGSYGWASAGRFHHAQSQLKRFLNCIGGYAGSKNTYSFAAAEVVVPHILGDVPGAPRSDHVLGHRRLRLRPLRRFRRSSPEERSDQSGRNGQSRTKGGSSGGGRRRR